jgi:hypothetical protein
MRSTTLLLAAFAVTCLFAFTRCGSRPFNPGDDASADASTDTPQLQDVIFNPQDSTNCGTTPTTCSGDGHAIVDCANNVVQTCDPTQGCSGGKCIPACDAAVANKSSVGCEYFAHNPRMVFGAGCFALYVANTWNADVSVTGDINGTTIDLSKYTYLPSGSGQSLKMTAIGQGGKIPPSKVGIVFLREGQDFGGSLSTACGYGVTVAEKDPAASAWTDPASGTSNAAKAIHVVASAPVVVYDILPFGGGRSEVTDASLLLPTSTWDTNYIAVTPVPLGSNCTNPGISIIASSDNTTVTIKPTVAIVAGTGVAATAANTPVTYPLSKGQVLRFEQAEDLLGSVISSNNPIGLWGEQSCINVDASACDGAHEQIPPIRAFGSEYVYGRYRNRVDNQDETPPTRITGAVDGTQLTWDPSPTGAQATVGKGQSFTVRSSGPFIVKSQDDQHPFYVATYMTGGAAFSDNGDPEFVNVVPTDQYLSRYVFFTDPTYPETNLVFIRKLGADKAFHDVTLDCAGTLTGWTPIGSSGTYEITRRDLVRHNFVGQSGCDNGSHESHSDGPYTLTVWGWGTAETGTTSTGIYSQYTSYAYPAGASVQSINNVVVLPN